MTCNGNSTEYCGGPGRLNLYSYGGATPAAAAAPSLTTAAPTDTPTLPSNFATLGCYTDSTGQRALSHFFNAASGGMTVEICINLCSTNGYAIAGVEYGGEYDNLMGRVHLLLVLFSSKASPDSPIRILGAIVTMSCGITTAWPLMATLAATCLALVMLARRVVGRIG